MRQVATGKDSRRVWGCEPTQHGHREVLASLGLGVRSHARVGAGLAGLQATQLQAATPGDHTVHHAALCGTGQGSESLNPFLYF